MGKTRKVGVTGRFGTRYGVSLRRRTKEIETGVRSHHVCPSCESKKVKRVSTGVWSCQKCGYKFAGGAYSPVVAREEVV
jgi:large subunit ribosomal protein L37Ae